MVESYDNIVSEMLDKHAPLKTRIVHERMRSPWISTEIVNEKRTKRRYERKWRITKANADKERFIIQKKKYNKLLRNAHTKYMSELVIENSNDPKSLFKLVNSLLKDKCENLLPEHESKVELAVRFNEYFIDKVDAIHNNLQNIRTLANSSTKEIRRYHMALTHFKETTADDILRIIQSSPKKSCSLDPVPTWLLTKCESAFIPIITPIINSSLTAAFVPIGLKSAVITPYLKKRNLTRILKNYRPISNSKYLSKLIERVIASQLHDHLLANNILEPMQSAYRKGHSTETALVRVQNDIRMVMDNKQVTMLLLLDLSAAFDTVCHKTLINRLEKRVGITGKALEWFSSYLENRQQCVSINNTKSKYSNLKFGVPQGSVLGPILFSLYTLPLADILKEHGVLYHLYADDTQVYMSFHPTNSNENKVTETMNNCLCEIKRWMTENFLQLNTDKTEMIIFGTRQMLLKVRNSNFNVAGEIIDVASCVKNLGVFLNNNLSMNDHINEICKKSFHEIRNISAIRKYLTLDACKTIVHALVCSRIDFNNCLYYGLPNTQIQRLQRIQNCAARLIFRKKKFDHITPYLIELHWLPVNSRIKFKLLVLTYKCLNNLAPSYLRDLLQLKPYSEFNLRSRDNPYLLRTRTPKLVSGGNRAFSIAAPVEWNKLPITIQSAESIDAFKRRLKTHLFQVAYF